MAGESNGIQAVLTDIGNVVLHVHPDRTLAMLADSAGVSTAEVLQAFDAMDGPDEAWHSINVGAQTVDEFGRERLGDWYDPDALVAAWMAMLGEDDPQVRSAYESLTVPLYVLSNTNDMHTAWLREHWLYRHVGPERFWASNEIGLRKPNPDCFRYALDRIGLPPAHVVFYDDGPANVAAARSVGMRAVLVDGPETVVGSLRELGLIGR